MDAKDGALVASTAVVEGDVRLGDRANVWWNAVLRGDDDSITVGANTNLQDFVMVHADPGVPLTIGRDVTVGHRATIHCAKVGDRCLIGIGSVLLAGVEIGDDAIVAAGAVVTEGTKVPPGVVVAGIPAKVLRDVRQEELDFAVPRADKYWKTAQERAR